MLTDLDTCYAALQVERKLALKRAERVAPLLDDAKRPPSTPADCSPTHGSVRRGRLLHAIRSVRWSLRPSHA